MGRLFGTDGIRGRANHYPITCEVALKTGRAVGLLSLQSNGTSILIGKDTRESGDMLESAIAAGATSVGVDVKFVGVIPTPAVAYLVSQLPDVGMGVMISASHNPYHDNGIKIFGGGGLKLTDEEQAFIEDTILNPKEKNVPQDKVGKISFFPEGCTQYAAFLKTKFPNGKPANPLKIVVDTSNGSASPVAPMVFDDENIFSTQFIHNHPDGKNINHRCGSQHIEDLIETVLKDRADIGLAFDGDADRLIAVDDKGIPVTGDKILAICANHAKEQGNLPNNMVVSTIMSNIGFKQALGKLNIQFKISDVGDRMVLQKMKSCGAAMGGEDSGHIIFLRDHSTGDGILSAIKLLEVMIHTQKPLSELGKIMTVYPQVLMNVKVDKSRPDFNKIPNITAVIGDVENKLGEQGRVLVRYSGTQPLLRVMVEGPSEKETKDYCEQICTVIKEEISS